MNFDQQLNHMFANEINRGLVHEDLILASFAVDLQNVDSVFGARNLWKHRLRESTPRSLPHLYMMML
jgi:hypothetical protein